MRLPEPSVFSEVTDNRCRYDDWLTAVDGDLPATPADEHVAAPVGASTRVRPDWPRIQ